MNEKPADKPFCDTEGIARSMLELKESLATIELVFTLSIFFYALMATGLLLVIFKVFGLM